MKDYKSARAEAKAAKAQAKAMRPWYKKKRWYALGTLTSSAGDGFTQSQAEYAATQVGL